MHLIGRGRYAREAYPEPRFAAGGVLPGVVIEPDIAALEAVGVASLQVGQPADGWTAGDTIHGYVPWTTQLAEIGGRNLSNPTGQPGFKVQQITNQAPNPSTANVDSDAAYAIEDSMFTNMLASCSGHQTVLFGFHVNTSFAAGFFSHSNRFGGHTLCGGYSRGAFITEWAFGLRVLNDFQVATTSGLFVQDCPDFNGDVFLDTAVAAYIIGGHVQQTTNSLYGAGSLTLQGATYHNATGNLWTVALPLSGGLFIGGVATAYSNETVAGVVTTRGGIALTAALLDTAPPVGFGGLAFVPSVGAFYDGRQP